MLDTGDANPRIRAALAKALGIDPAIVAQAFTETRNQQAEYAQQLAAHQEARDRHWFRPHIQIKMDIRKARFGLTALIFCDTPELRRIEVPHYVPAQAEDVQLALVRSLIDEFPSTRYGRRYGHCYDKPTLYIYCPAYDEAWELSPDLELVRKYAGAVIPAGFGLRIGNRIITGRQVKAANPL